MWSLGRYSGDIQIGEWLEYAPRSSSFSTKFVYLCLRLLLIRSARRGHAVTRNDGITQSVYAWSGHEGVCGDALDNRPSRTVCERSRDLPIASMGNRVSGSLLRV
jgi:hypothetical protein